MADLSFNFHAIPEFNEIRSSSCWRILEERYFRSKVEGYYKIAIRLNEAP
jgi:hypothetical protein